MQERALDPKDNYYWSREGMQQRLGNYRAELGQDSFNTQVGHILERGLASKSVLLQEAVELLDAASTDSELHPSETDSIKTTVVEYASCDLPADSTPDTTTLSDLDPSGKSWDVEHICLDLVNVGIIGCDVCHGQKVDLAPSRLRRYEQMYKRAAGLPIGDMCSICSDSITEWEHNMHCVYANYHNYSYCLYDYTPLTEPVITKGMCPLGLDCPGDGDCQSCWSCKQNADSLIDEWRKQRDNWNLATSGHYRDY